MQATIIRSAIDWITLTCPTTGGLDYEQINHLRAQILRTVYGGQAGVEIRPWNWNGYAGRTLGSFAWGERRDGWIVRASSDTAAVVAAALPWLGWRPSRLDVQLTVRHNEKPDTVISMCRAQALVSRETLPAGRAAKIRFVQGHGDGDTLLIGSRRSQVYVRIYNKEAESGGDAEYAGCVRYEIEFKGNAAEQAWGMLVDARDQAREVRNIVLAKMHHYGIRTLESFDVSPKYNVVSSVKASDLDTQLLWLERSVRPLVKKWLDRGYEDDILRALGLASADEHDAIAPEQTSMF